MENIKIPVQFKEDPIGAKLAFLDQGYHVECGIWSDTECDAIIDTGEKYRGTITDGPMILDQVHKLDEQFVIAMKKTEVVDIIEYIFSENASGIQSGFFFCPPGTRGFLAHQDNIFVDADPRSFILAWTALCDVGRDNGCLFLYPNTHREPILPLRSVTDEAPIDMLADAYSGETAVPEGYEPSAVVVPRGSTVFLHGHTVHGSNKNLSDSCRYAMFNSYVREGTKFRPGNRVNRVEVSLVGCRY